MRQATGWGAAVLAGLLAAATWGADAYPLRDAVACTPRLGLPAAAAKLAAGQPVRIAYLGGSITAQEGWRPKTLAWFRRQYTNAAISEINAAIGGTGSDLGAFRLAHDVLRHQPDLLFVEFAVNDGGAAPERIHQAMEGIVRQTLRANPATDICFVYTAVEGMLPDLQAGKYPRAASAMEAVADHYGLPSIHMALEAARLAGEGKVVFKAPTPKTDAEKAALAGKIIFSEDGVHPHPETGHALYTNAVVQAMRQILPLRAPRPAALPAPLRADNWENACLVPLSAVAKTEGWRRLDPAQDNLAKRFGNRLPELWKAEKPGAALTVKFKGTLVGVYDLLGPDGGQIEAKVDDQPPRSIKRIDGYCTYHRLAMLTLADGLPDASHTATLTLEATAPDKAAILFEHNRPDLVAHPEKYAANTWYAGGVMLLGTIEN